MKYNRIPPNHIGEVGDMGVTTLSGVDYFIVKFPSGWGVLGVSSTVEQIIAASAATATDGVANVQTIRDFWSQDQNDLIITGSATTIGLTNTLVIPAGDHGIPVGATIDYVHLLLKWTQVKDTSTSDNAIDNAAMSVQIDNDADDGWLTGYTFTNGACEVDVSESTISGGDMKEGLIDIQSRVTGADTYDAQIINAQAIGSNLLLQDFQWGVRVSLAI